MIFFILLFGYFLKIATLFGYFLELFALQSLHKRVRSESQLKEIIKIVKATTTTTTTKTLQIQYTCLPYLDYKPACFKVETGLCDFPKMVINITKTDLRKLSFEIALCCRKCKIANEDFCG